VSLDAGDKEELFRVLLESSVDGRWSVALFPAMFAYCLLLAGNVSLINGELASMCACTSCRL
jgi:hypothetical protein